MLVAMAVILVLLAISVLFCYRQCTKQRAPEMFDGGVSGTGINQRKQTADNSEDEDEDEENDEFVDTDEEEVFLERESIRGNKQRITQRMKMRMKRMTSLWIQM